MLLLKDWSLDDAGEKFESIRNFLLISGTDPNNYIKSISYGEPLGLNRRFFA